MNDDNIYTDAQNPLERTLNAARMKTFLRIDEFLSQRGRDENPASITEIAKELGLKKNQERGLRINMEHLCELSDDKISSFAITKVRTGRSTKYMIMPGHSLFHHNLNETEKKLIDDLFHIMGCFDNPNLRQVEDLRKAASGSSDKQERAKCVDFGIQAPADKTLFSRLFDAISDRRVIDLTYKPMQWLSDSTTEEKTITFCPWQIKLFGDRWGLIGMAQEDGYILKFYLDQIASIKVWSDQFDEKEKKRMEYLFDNLVGMSTPRHLCEKRPDPETVVYPEDVYVWVHPKRAQYLRNFPLHPNMDEIDSASEQARELLKKYPTLPEGGSIFWMSVYITHPLKQLLVSYLDRMIVLEPESLRIDLEERIGRMHGLYRDLSSGKEGVQPDIPDCNE